MKKFIFRSVFMLLLAACCCTSAMAQRHIRPHSHHSHYSRSNSFLDGLEAVETIADYAILGTMLHGLDDYTGIRFGLNSASLRTSGFEATEDNITGCNLGFVFGWYLGHSPIVFEPGIYYSMKGGKIREYAEVGSHDFTLLDTKITTHQFEIPLVFKCVIPVAPQVTLEPLAGPFLSFGFAGTTTDNYQKVDTYDDGVLEDFDAGLRLGAGLALGHLYLETAYDLGLVNLCHNYAWDRHDALRSRTWTFNVGFNF